MADPKTAEKPKTKAETAEVDPVDATKERVAAHEASASSAQNQFVAVGRLRRDTMILGANEDPDVINQLASEAVRQGRAAEVFVFEAVGYFSESEVDFVLAPVASQRLRADQTESRVPLLNPSTGEQALDNSKPEDSSAVQAPVPTHGATGEGDSNNGAGTGTGNADKVADANKSEKPKGE